MANEHKSESHKHKEEPKKAETKAVENKNSKTAYIIFGIVIGVLVLIFISQFFLKSNGGSTTTTTSNGVDGQYDALAKCLTGKGVVFYGTSWCPHCNTQKEMFGSSMQYVIFVDCDEQKQRCAQAGIEAYPTWKIPGNEDLLGTQQLQDLADIAGCTA